MLHLEHFASLGEALWDTTITHQSNDALIEADRHRERGRWRYGDLRAQARRVAGALQAAGVEAGDRVAILMSNQAKWLISATGAFWAGAVVVPLDYKLEPADQAMLLAHAEAKVLVTEFPIWREHAEPLKVEQVWVTEAPEGALTDAPGVLAWAHIDAAPPIEVPVARQRTSLATIVYSSGTSGTPKGCMLTHENYLAQAQALGELYPMTPDERFFSILPTNHAIDFMTGFFMPLMFGAAIVHQRTLRPQFLAPTMKRYGITHMAMVPRILRALEEKLREGIDALPGWKRVVIESLITANDVVTLKAPNHKLSSTLLRGIHEQLGGKLRLVFSGGAFVDPEIAEFFYRIGIPVVIGYGLTEAGTVLTVNDLKPFRPDSVGKPVDGVTLEVRGAAPGDVGEVWVRGRTVMQGYFKAPELTAETIVDGWLRTGDLGYLDASGHLHLVGRKKNMIVTTGGKNVYPEEVEAKFEGIDGLEEFAVVAARAVWGDAAPEQLVLVAHLERGASIEAVRLAAQEANRALVAYKRVSGWLRVDEPLPRTASLKIKRALLHEVLAGTDPNSIEVPL